jgi:hypothetical protein
MPGSRVRVPPFPFKPTSYARRFSAVSDLDGERKDTSPASDPLPWVQVSWLLELKLRHLAHPNASQASAWFGKEESHGWYNCRDAEP